MEKKKLCSFETEQFSPILSRFSWEWVGVESEFLLSVNETLSEWVLSGNLMRLRWPISQFQIPNRRWGCLATILCRFIFLPQRLDGPPWYSGLSAAQRHSAPTSQEHFFLKAMLGRQTMIVKFMPAMFPCAVLKSGSCYNYMLWRWLNNFPQSSYWFWP